MIMVQQKLRYNGLWSEPNLNFEVNKLYLVVLMYFAVTQPKDAPKPMEVR